MSEKTIKRVKCPKCGAERETPSNTSTMCKGLKTDGEKCGNCIWVPSNLVEGSIDPKPSAPVKKAPPPEKKEPLPTGVLAVDEIPIMLDRADIRAADLLVESIREKSCALAVAERKSDGEPMVLLVEFDEEAMLVLGTVLTPEHADGFKNITPVIMV